MLKGRENEILKFNKYQSLRFNLYYNKNSEKLYFHDIKKFSWQLLSFPLFLRLAHANKSFILIPPCFPYDVNWLQILT